jgi:pSer/pThr/pTyr-binding forkhead associated (FHA) protein
LTSGERPATLALALNDLPLALHSSSPSELKARLEADRRGAPYLLYRPHADEQRILELTAQLERATIGRQEACDVALPEDPSVSRVHAVLDRIGEEWTLVDDGSSRNGSFVNGQRVHGRQRLRDGDLVRVGDTLIAFRAAREGEQPASADTVPAMASAIVVSNAQRRVLVALCRPFADAGFAALPSNADIAEELFLSTETVKSHLHALFQAFDLDEVPPQQKRARLAASALEQGVVTLVDLTAV